MYYIAFFFLLIFLFSFFGGSRIVVNYGYVKNVWIFVFIGLFLLIGLRNKTVGTDTITYVSDFLNERTYTLSQLFQDQFEPLYSLLLMFCQRITTNYTVFLLIFAFPIALGFALFVREFSEDYFLSVLIFSVLGIMHFSMAGLRQTVALSFTLAAFHFAYKRKLLPFLVLCFVASGFHNSAIIFVIVYPLLGLKVRWRHWIAVGIALVLGITRNGIVMQIASFFMNEDRYGHYLDGSNSSLNLTMFFIQILFLLLCFLFKEQVLGQNPTDNLFYNMAFIGLIFQAFTPITGEFFRLSMYFSISLCVLVPKTIQLIYDERMKKMAYLGIVSCGLAYTFLIPTSYVYSYCLF